MPDETIKLPTDQPLLLLPVRLETRFRTVEGQPPARFLDVRIYPDEIHIDTHEAALTEEELSWGQHFMSETAKGNERAAWGQLAARFTPQRAAWIARVLETAGPDKIERRTGTWTREPYTQVLPDRWVALGYAGGKEVFRQAGGRIPDALATGPEPNAPLKAGFRVQWDEQMEWMFDFQRAKEVGMALSIQLDSATGETGLDRLVVVGVKETRSDGTKITSAQQGELLRKLLDAQHYTRGLSFIPQGTPTNNTPAAPSGFTSNDGGYEVSYRVERGAARGQAEGENGAVLARALGVDPRVFAHIRYAGGDDDRISAGHEQTDAADMNTALWSATWGYFLSQLMAGVIDSGGIRSARRHFIDYVRARGPFPALRIGCQPYGVLPVTTLDRWESGGDDDLDLLAELLFALRQVWRGSVPEVPRVGKSNKPDEELLRSLSLEPTSTRYAARNVLGPQYITYLWGLVRYETGEWWTRQEAIARRLLTKLKAGQAAWAAPRINFESWDPRGINFVTGGRAFPLSDVLVQEGETSETKQLGLNYIEWLLDSGYDVIRREGRLDFQGAPRPLLYLLLRHAALLEYHGAALAILDLTQTAARLEPELVNIAPTTETETVWERLQQRLGGSGGPTVGEYLDRPANYPSLNYSAQAAELEEFRRSLGALKDRPAAVLERLLPETLDLCAHRLDAWITSLATRRIAGMNRGGGFPGVYLGGYGWVENLRPNREGGPRSQAGFVHAPSLTQAAAAAVLRSGYLSHGKVQKNRAFAVDLSSRRVREALWILDAVRQGQPLGAVLGYRFERGLHKRFKKGAAESSLDKYVSFFRKLAPLSTETKEDESQVTELSGAAATVAANNVADGLELHKRWRRGESTNLWTWASIPFGMTSSLPPLGSQEARLIMDELAALDRALDSVGDLSVAESVYQVARGNPERASAVLNSLGRGDAPPPEIEVVRTPRTGLGVTHRLLVPLSGDPLAPGGWQMIEHVHARAWAEPNLNAWVGSLLGDPSRVLCRAVYLGPSAGEQLGEPRTVRLSELYLSALDALYIIQGGAQEAQASELDRRLTYWLLLSRPADVPADARVRLDFSRDPSWSADVLSVAEFIEVVRALDRVVTSSRPLEPRDLSWPAGPATAKHYEEVVTGSGKNGLQDLIERADGAVGDLAKLRNLDTSEAADLGQLRNSLLLLSFFGIQGAVPLSPAGETEADRAALTSQAASVKRVVEQRLDAAAGLPVPPRPSTTAPQEEQDRYVEEVRDYQVKRLQAVFGGGFLALTRFKAPDADAALSGSFGNLLKSAPILCEVKWFQRAARVREAVGRLDRAMMYAEATNPKAALTLKVGQLPYEANDTWVALPGSDIPGGRLSLVALADSPDFSHLAGLMVDEWVEVVPGAVEKTGVAFQFNEPRARPPQAMLLAAAPAAQSAWDVDTLAATVLETFDLAQSRLVDPDALKEVGQFLPALWFAYNKAGEAVTADFTRIAGTGV